MILVSAEEVVPGLVVHLYPEKLIEIGGCQVKVVPGSEVQDAHYFLVVDVYPDDDLCLATPLFSEKNGIRDRVLLCDEEKTGKEENWKGIDSYYYKWQFWRIPFSAIEAASYSDNSTAGDRRMYAKSNEILMNNIKSNLSRLRENWRSYPSP